MRAWSASLWLAYPVVSPTHKASNLAAFLASLASAMTFSSVSSLWCPLALAGRLPTPSAKCRMWKVTSSCERSLITAHLYDMPGHGEEPLGAVDLDLVFAAVGHVASDDDVKPTACGGEFRVAVEVVDNLKSPQ